MKKILMLVLVAVVVSACAKHDPSDGGEFTKLKKYVIYDTEKMKTNNGTDCPSRKKGRCVSKVGKDYVSVGNDVVVNMGWYDNKYLFVAVDDDYKEDMYAVEQDWIIWDKEILRDFNLKAPVLIKAGKYDFYKDRNYGRYALLPFEKADLKEGVVIFMEEKYWRAEYFYEGYLGECNVLTGVVDMTLTEEGNLKDPRHLALVLPYENNIQEGGDRLMEIIKEGKMILENDVWVTGLNVKVMKGTYRVKEKNEGAMVELIIDN